MCRLLQLEGLEVGFEMSPEFEAHLDVSLEKLVNLIDLHQESGRLFKFKEGHWSTEPDQSSRACFLAGWRRIDPAPLMRAEMPPIRLYFAAHWHLVRQLSWSKASGIGPLSLHTGIVTENLKRK